MSENSIAVPSAPGSGSPFDALRREDENGEYWTARDLQIAMGYEKWERFDGVVDRAIRSAENTATYSDQAFSRIREEGLPGGGALKFPPPAFAATLAHEHHDRIPAAAR